MADTIFALATASGRGAVAIVRLSGPQAGAALGALGGPLDAPRRARRSQLLTPHGEMLDDALTLWFPAPASFTGEDCAELHLHGGRAVVEAVSEALLQLGVRPAEPGEFSRRAFEHGKLDLSQAEAVADLVDAETAAQRRQALHQLGGSMSRLYDRWRAALVGLLARLEAAIDFPDEDLPAGVADGVLADLCTLRAELVRALNDSDRGRRIRDGYRIALIGAPNAGKSSLFNALIGRDAAIVTPIAGTTRDVIEAPLMLGGHAVILADTAGLRDSHDPIEREGVRRADAWARTADLRVWVDDGAGPAPEALTPGDVTVGSKADERASQGDGLPVSAVTGSGIAELRAALERRVAADLTGADFPAVTRARHAAALREAIESLGRAEASFALGPELAAEDIRIAARALSRVTGGIGVDHVLDEVFATFCIGK